MRRLLIPTAAGLALLASGGAASAQGHEHGGNPGAGGQPGMHGPAGGVPSVNPVPPAVLVESRVARAGISRSTELARRVPLIKTSQIVVLSRSGSPGTPAGNRAPGQ